MKIEPKETPPDVMALIEARHRNEAPHVKARQTWRDVESLLQHVAFLESKLRPIPVSERAPAQADGNQYGNVMWWWTMPGGTIICGSNMSRWDFYDKWPGDAPMPSHWSSVSPLPTKGGET